MLRPTLLRFLVWLIWCYAARRPLFHKSGYVEGTWIAPVLFHKSYRRSCYASGVYNKAEGGTRVQSHNA
ncbi:hypothetical protein CY34DRAFT_814531 [Suillus luteus UH-Slu-Lm8-n1]|uniref:Secreted protein n=1 Tax=Suillus luteus UH-Slu-Lm8-n1 TaxID=930992 RepID=A0A0C9Z2R9_9AGAM|nr:hypothetical protein CY34DRAFT_814531 [Suillus luteus UH-Slu-Lm8-n1]